MDCTDRIFMEDIYGPSVSPFLKTRFLYIYIYIYICGPSVNPFLQKSPYIWTVSHSISEEKSIYGPHGPYLEAACCLGTFAKESILGTCSWKNELGNFGKKVKTNTFREMAPQAKPLCS